MRATVGFRVAGVLVLLTGLLSQALLAPAAAPSPVQSISSSSNLVIVCTNGGDFSSSAAVFRGDVRVLESQMYMECELLTVYFQTNTPARPEVRGLTNVNARIEMIIAETNLMMMARDTTIIGDRAVYTISNEVVVVTGALVVIETEKSYTYGEQFVFNRRTGAGYAVGPTVVEIKMSGTNLLKPMVGSARKTNAPPAPPKSEGSR
jgi:lipopolysaccharide export system protein LptA